MKPLISVIVPVYKAEQYLEKCVQSIQQQTYENLEIILINDGSPDRCGEMCDALARQDERIRVIHKENGGQSSARNKGLDVMTGDLVAFVDSDDWIEPDMLQMLLELKQRTGAQISACGTQLDGSKGIVGYFNLAYPADKEGCVYTKMEALRASLDNQKITYSLCDKLYDRVIFEGLRMSEGKIYEDMELIPQCLERAQAVVYDPTPMYHYRMTPESTIRGNYNPKRFAEADVAWAKVEDYQTRYLELYIPACAAYLDIAMAIIHKSRGSKACAQRRQELISHLQGELPAAVLSDLKKSTRIKLSCLRVGILPFELLMGINDLIKSLRG